MEPRYASGTTSAGVRERGKCAEGHTGTCEGLRVSGGRKPLRTDWAEKKAPGFSRAPGEKRLRKERDETGANHPEPGV